MKKLVWAAAFSLTACATQPVKPPALAEIDEQACETLGFPKENPQHVMCRQAAHLRHLSIGAKSPIPLDSVFHELCSVTRQSRLGTQPFLPFQDGLPNFPVTRSTPPGYATIGGTVNEHGSLEDPVILESTGTPQFNQIALEGASTMRFCPAVKDGKPVRQSGYKYRYTWRPSS